MTEEKPVATGQTVRSGGRYIIDPKTGERTLVEEPTQPHPEGAGPRDADGNPIPPHGSIGGEA